MTSKLYARNINISILSLAFLFDKKNYLHQYAQQSIAHIKCQLIFH